MSIKSPLTQLSHLAASSLSTTTIPTLDRFCPCLTQVVACSKPSSMSPTVHSSSSHAYTTTHLPSLPYRRHYLSSSPYGDMVSRCTIIPQSHSLLSHPTSHLHLHIRAHPCSSHNVPLTDSLQAIPPHPSRTKTLHTSHLDIGLESHQVRHRVRDEQ